MYGYRLAQYGRSHGRPLVRHAGVQKRKESGGETQRQRWIGIFPKCYAVRVYHGVKSKRLVPVIPNLVFVHASRTQITDFKKHYNFLQFVMWEKSTGLEYLVVPDDQMESFIKVSSQYEENITYYNPDELDLQKGRRVRIHGGKLNGVTGIFMQVQGKRNRRVVVLLEGVMAVAAEVHPDLIEVIS